MNTALWIAQGVLALGMLATGTLKLVMPRDKLARKMKWAATWEPRRVKLLGVAEVTGAIGVVVPWATGTAPLLTPLAACCLLVLMGGAVKTHLDLKESPAPPVIVGALCMFVALGRLGAFR